jgi:hypothetical protein
VPQDYLVFDPLAASVLNAHRDGKTEPLAHARMVFGERREVFALTTRLEERSQPFKLAILDLTVVQGIGDSTRLAPLIDLAQRRPVAVALRRAVAARHRAALNSAPFAVIEVADPPRGEVVAIAPGGLANIELLHSQGIAQGVDFRQYYLSSREWWLTDLAKTGLRVPDPGKRYHVLGDGTRANVWLDVKQMVGSTETGFEIGYHLAREISRDFTTSPEEVTLVVGNNTSAVLAMHARLVLGACASVAVFDRLGPFPYLAKPRIDAFPPVGANAVIVEDVISTGREVDLIALLAIVSGREISEVHTVFHLEIAEPLLIQRDRVHAMARPTLALNYVRLPSVTPDDPTP